MRESAWPAVLMVSTFRIQRAAPLFIYAALASTLLFPVVAVNFTACLAEIQGPGAPWGTTGGTDNYGNPINILNATAITHELCTRACGQGSEPFSWSVFSQQFGSWLLPWLALISQLPFGARLRSDNLMSMLLAVGSPMLAGYSLALTVLNGQWVARRFAPYKYPNTYQAVRVLSSLQQAPLKITEEGLASLVVLAENDPWWSELTLWLDYTHTWSISAAASIAWVVIAYIFTVIDSFSNVTNSVNSNGQAVGSVWLWLLAVVTGWLQISPKCDSSRLIQAMEKANRIAYVASKDGVVLAGDRSALRVFSLQRYRPGTLHVDEECTSPIYNYARFLPWVQAVEKVSSAFQRASENASHHRPVNQNVAWQNNQDGGVHPANRIGSPEQVEDYCGKADYECRSRWGPDVVSRFLVASALSLVLQWGTTGAAVIVVWFTPTRGLGCRSGAYILYAAVSTLVWVIMMTSSALAHYSTFPSPYEPPYRAFGSLTTAALASIILRRVGKLLATLNALWIIVACVFQFSSFFDRCYCNSSVLGLGAKAFNVMVFDDIDIADMRSAWTSGVVLALTCASVYVGFVNLFMDPPLAD